MSAYHEWTTRSADVVMSRYMMYERGSQCWMPAEVLHDANTSGMLASSTLWSFIALLWSGGSSIEGFHLVNENRAPISAAVQLLLETDCSF